MNAIKDNWDVLSQFRHIKKVLAHQSLPRFPLRGKTVVFTYLLPHRFFVLMYGFWAALFSRLGARIFIIYDNNSLHIADNIHYRLIPPDRRQHPCLNPYRRWTMRWKAPYMKWAFRRFFPDIHFIPYSLVAPHSDTAVFGEEKARFVDPHVFSSMVRFFERDNFKEDPTLPDELFRPLFQANAQRNLAMGKWIARHLKPSVIISHHGFYTTWGPAADYLKSQGLRVKILTPHSYVGLKWGQISSGNDIYTLQPSDKAVIRELPLQPARIEHVRKFMDQRTMGKGVDVKALFHQGMQKDVPEIRNFVTRIKQAHPDARVFGLFPNVMWDANILQSHRIFKGSLTWIRQTIEWINRSPHGLIIRVHPSEATVLQGTYSLMEELKKMDFNPQKILIIPPDRPISSYWLIQEVIDLTLTYTGFIGVESAYLGTPAMTAANSPYSDLGIMHEPPTAEAYFSILNKKIFDLPHASEQASRLIAFLLEKHRWWFPMIEKSNTAFRSINLRNVSEEYLTSSEMLRILHRIFHE